MNNLILRHPVSLLNILEDIDDSKWLNHWEPGNGYALPAVDIQEKGDKYILEAELPGLEEKDIEVTIEDNQLSIRGHKNIEKEKGDNKYLVRERHATKFERSFRLSSKVDQEKIDARFKNGILTVVAPKKAESKPAKIAIKAA